jgi:arabinose-5-phosphate isomerase
MTTVLDAEARLAGIVTDGDLRRLMQQRGSEAFHVSAGECMTKAPVTLSPLELAGTALNMMERRRITSIVVVDKEQRPLGVLHLHDLWTLELF